jgi:DNA-binding NarL/FixJ family response regulator
LVYLSEIMGQIQRFSSRILQAVRAHLTGNQKVLLVAAESYDAIDRLCRRLELDLNYTASLPLALCELQDNRFDVVIYDQDMPCQDWRAAVPALAQASPRSSVLLLSTVRQAEIWNEVIRIGGHDMLTKPISEQVAESTLALARARAKVNRIRSARAVAFP